MSLGADEDSALKETAKTLDVTPLTTVPPMSTRQ